MGTFLSFLAQTFWLPEQASTIAPEVDSLYYFVYWASVIIFVGVVAAMVYLAYRFRRKSEDERPEPVHENKWLEVSWIVVPTILVLLVFNWGFQSFINLKTAPPDSYEVHVRAMQWSWQFEYPNGTTSTNELRVPVDRPVRLIMSSQDVIHSVGIPAFRVKHDVLPDRYTSLWFQATQEGEYPLYCTEYCGTEHATMDARVIVESQEDFNEWVETAGIDEDAPLVEVGEMAYQSCQACHSIDGTDGIGPTFQGLYMSERPQQDGTVRIADEDYLRESILEPQNSITEGYDPIMPSFAHLSERQVSGLIEFIRAQE